MSQGGEACPFVGSHGEIVYYDEAGQGTQRLRWYGVRVRSQYEKVTSAALDHKGLEKFVPMMRARRRWSDRVKQVEAPLFPGYVFCRFDARQRVPVLDCPGVVDIVSFGGLPAAIPDEEIEAVRAMLCSKLPVAPHPFLRSGQKIRIERGPLTGVDGVVVEVKKQFRLVTSVTLLQRSVSVEVEREWVCPIS